MGNECSKTWELLYFSPLNQSTNILPSTRSLFVYIERIVYPPIKPKSLVYSWNERKRGKNKNKEKKKFESEREVDYSGRKISLSLTVCHRGVFYGSSSRFYDQDKLVRQVKSFLLVSPRVVRGCGQVRFINSHSWSYSCCCVNTLSSFFKANF